ncbi:Inward rectifier potassium channel Irk [Flavobacterium supellecticarium]|uniref:Inward rectifier potassium channel Irk n=1 Tax=Flavobacterium supellecticarium TaxID=2565924 RepID=A0A4S3ZZS1_9FLAO|nr:ion channel [Flavobacterium supellecticarium]THF51417.1 Inward rectifier potassium channel Irk [Flavobacterium supellecticarium]
MAFLKRISSRAKADENTGFGSNASIYGARFVNKDGNANVRKVGIGITERISWYHAMIDVPRWKFMFIIFAFYLIVNFIFACIYFLLGVQHLQGINAKTAVDQFGQAFFFSAQTFTTVGYGHISPTGFMTSFVASVEALFGLLSFAIATGLFYGRFSKPKALIRFSDNAVIAPYKEGKALMLRMTPYKNTNLMEAEAKATIGLSLEEDGKKVNKFFSLDLELDKINMLTLSWTLVHPITENSPLYTFTEADYKNQKGEILIFVKVFDDMFSTTVVKRTSYTLREVIYGARFLPMFEADRDSDETILYVDKLNAIEKIQL